MSPLFFFLMQFAILAYALVGGVFLAFALSRESRAAAERIFLKSAGPSRRPIQAFGRSATLSL